MNEHTGNESLSSINYKQHSAAPRIAIKEPYEPDMKDAVFAVSVLILGFLFARWVAFYWQGWSVAVFTAGYCLATAIYFFKDGIKISAEGRVWLAVTALTGISYALWNNLSLEPWRSLLLLFSGVYWVICATGLPLLGKTSNYLPLDFLNGLLIVPLNNLDCQFKSFAFWGKKKQGTLNQLFSISLGIALALIVGSMVLPLLIEADSGGFAKITNSSLQLLQGLRSEISELFFNLLIAIPTAAYIFGLVAGSAKKRGLFPFKQAELEKSLTSVRLLPAVSVYTLLGLVCSLYALFILSQLPYFFSAFAGERPQGWLIYSEYARKGFFELCTIAAINLTLLSAANLFSIKRQASPTLKLFNVLLAALTLLLISTAFSKMALYIGAYGLSVRRLLPSAFLIFLAVICGGVIALQKRQFSILRLVAVTGAVMLCLLTLINPDGLVARYNANRYLAETLSSFDVEILYHGGAAGVEPALQVYNQTNDSLLRNQLASYLKHQEQRSAQYAATPWDSLENLRARLQTGQ